MGTNTDQNTSLSKEKTEPTTAPASNIRRIHDAGHKAIVWTVNRRAAIHRFLMSDADAIITDKVGKSQAIRQQLKKRTYLERILDAIL